MLFWNGVTVKEIFAVRTRNPIFATSLHWVGIVGRMDLVRWWLCASGSTQRVVRGGNEVVRKTKGGQCIMRGKGGRVRCKSWWSGKGMHEIGVEMASVRAGGVMWGRIES